MGEFLALRGDLAEVAVDPTSGLVLQFANRRSGRFHLLSRLPELALGEPGMGIVELEPFYPKGGEVSVGGGEVVARFREGQLVAERRVRVGGASALYEFRVRNEGREVIPVRLRVALYLAPGRGGFWGEAEGATYSCRYFASYGYRGLMGTFSTTCVPEGARGFAFEKHSYRSRAFPELKWFAAVDADLREGVGVLCLTPGCYGVVEDQFFNLELNLVKPEELLGPGEEASIAFELYALSGLSRVDHLSPRMAVAVESPSVALPGEKYGGELRVFPFRDLQGDLEVWLELVRGMASIGKRGYCVDRVPPGVRRLPLSVESLPPPRRFELGAARFETLEPLDWMMDRELYELAYVRARVCGEEVVRAFSLNPDAARVYRLLPENLKKRARAILEFNAPVESEHMEREASLPLLAAFSKAARLKRGRVLRETPELSPELERLVLELLAEKWELVERAASGRVDSRVASSAPVLLLALGYLAARREAFLKALRNLYAYMVEGVERGTYIDWFNALQGGGGASRFADYAVALDIVGEELGGFLEDVLWALSWLKDELVKLTSAWAGNWEISEAAGLLALSIELGGNEYRSDPAFLKAYATVLATLDSFLPDGAWPELAAGYHLYALESLLKALEVLKLSGAADLYSYEGRCGKPVVEKALEWLWGLATPEGRLPALEDSGEFKLPPDPFVIAGVRRGSSELLSIAGRLMREGAKVSSPYAILALADSGVPLAGIEGAPPPSPRPRVAVFESSGRFVFRASDEPGSLYVVLDFGPQGGWHGHPDRLSFEVHRRGEAVVVDAGSAGYYTRLHWEWSKRSIAHNTVTLGERDHPEGSGGRLLSLSWDGGRAETVFEAPIAEGAVLRRKLTVDAGAEAVEVEDEVVGKGVFRWNLHLRGEILARGKGALEVRTARNALRVELPEWAEVRVAEGWRGFSERTIYVYYEVPVEGRGLMGGMIVFTGGAPP